MLVRLASLLRHSLDRGEQPTVPLREELAFLDQYLDLEQMRFPSRLLVERHIDPALLDKPVPNLLLQPLVENAIKHGVEPLSRPVTVSIHASSSGPGRLRVEVLDDGAGLPPESGGGDRREGIGTSNTRRRLLQLHGRNASFNLERLPDGRTRAAVEFPVPA